jgi:hypothetical protein
VEGFSLRRHPHYLYTTRYLFPQEFFGIFEKNFLAAATFFP